MQRFPEVEVEVEAEACAAAACSDPIITDDVSVSASARSASPYRGVMGMPLTAVPIIPPDCEDPVSF